MANLVQLSPAYFPESSIGTPVGAGTIYVGQPDTDPEIVGNQKVVTALQEDGSSVVMTQPITLSAGGIPLYSGSPVSLYTNGSYSLTVLDINGAQVYHVPSIVGSSEQGNFYYPDYTETDQGVAGNGNTVKTFVDAIGATNKATIYLKHNSGSEFTEYIFATTESIPSNITVIFENGAVIKDTATGASLTINGNIEAGFEKIFDWGNGAGSLSLIGTVYPEWWDVDGTADDVQINQAITSIVSGIVQLASNTTYNTTAAINGKSGVTLLGDGRGSTKISAIGNIDIINLTGSVTSAQAVTVQADQGQFDVSITSDSAFSVNDDVVIGKADHASFENYVDFVETNIVESKGANVLTMKAPLYDTYSTSYFAFIATFIKNFIVDGIGFIHSTSSNDKFHIDAVYTKDCIVRNCSFYLGARVEYNISENFTIENCTHEGNAGAAISVKRSKYCKVLYNTMIDGVTGIAANYTGDQVQIIGNILRNTSGVGISVNNQSRGSLTKGNNIQNSGSYGIAYDWNSWHSKIVENEISYAGNTGIIYVGNYATISNNIMRGGTAGQGIVIEDGQYNVISSNIIRDQGTLTSHHGIKIALGANEIRASEFNIVVGNTLDGVTGESIFLGAAGEAKPTANNIVTGNIIDNARLAISARMTGTTFNKIYGNIIGAISVAGFSSAGTDVMNDRTFVSDRIDLSGAAFSQTLWVVKVPAIVTLITIYFSEGSSADAGVALYVGRSDNTDILLKIEAGSATLVSQGGRSSINFTIGGATAEGILNSGNLTVDKDLVVTLPAGGKTGAGEVIVVCEVLEVGPLA